MKKIFFFLFLFSLSIHALLYAEPILSTLNELQWKNRIIITTSKVSDSPSIFAKYKNEINDRNIIWFVLFENSVTSNYQGIMSLDLQNEINSLLDNKKETILIGKDGTIKQQSSSLNLENIFSLIDTMPMRKREMKAKSH